MAYIPIKTVGISDGPNLDSFSRLRISNPNLILSAITDTADRTLYWDGLTATGGTNTYNSTSGCFDMEVTTSNASRAVRQTREYYSYRAGQAQLIFVTFAMGAPKANLTQRVGYFDDTEGIYLEQAGTSIAFKIKSNVTGSATYETANQADWNLDDLLGGGGSGNKSGVTLDLEETQILVIDFQWLGVGRVRVGFDIGGEIIYVHEFLHANTGNGNSGLPYLKSPKLPVRYEIVNTAGTASNSKLRAICAAVVREGASDAPSPIRVVWTNNDTMPTTTTTLRSVLGVRLDSTNKRAALGMIETTVLNDSNVHLFWCLIINPTWTSGSATWVAVPGSDAISEMSRTQLSVVVSATAGIEGMPTAGIVIDGGNLGGGLGSAKENSAMKVEDTLRLVSNLAGTQDELWLCARTHSSTGNISATITYKEFR